MHIPVNLHFYFQRNIPKRDNLQNFMVIKSLLHIHAQIFILYLYLLVGVFFHVKLRS